MQAPKTVIHSVPPSKPVPEKPKPKTTALDWIRNGFRFPGKVRP
jgi:hypothetical protein